MKIIEEELRSLLSCVHPADDVVMPRALLERVIVELTHLRSLAGAVSQGESFSDIKNRQGPTPEEILKMLQEG